MKKQTKIALFLALVLGLAALAGCGSSDKVKDPLADFGVDAVVPFPTKQPGAPTAPPAAPSPSPTQLIAGVTQGWQTEQLPVATPSASSEYPQLARGNSGDGVKKLQERLKELGYLTGTADGSFGTQTETAVKRFQQAIGLTQTGVASTYMQQTLYSSAAPRYSGPAYTATPRPTNPPSAPSATTNPYAQMSYGDSGSNVRILQNRLKELGYLAGTADGIYGQQTRTAIMRFEAAYNKPQTGIATEALLKVLYSSEARSYSQAFPTATATPAPSTGYAQLSYNSKGEAVTRLQTRLIELGYLAGQPTGNYYNLTVEAVKKFQAQIGLVQTGVATTALQQQLFSPYAPRYGGQAAPTTAPGGYSQLSYNSTGQAVKEMQERLIELGFLSGTADGLFYNQTVEAVKRFQAALGWNQTGVASAEMLAMLFSSNAPNASGYTELSIGSTGTAVYALQARLVELGFASGTPGGTYGASTAGIVKSFQAAAGLPQTGVATVETQRILYSANAPSKNAASTRPTATPVPTAPPTAGIIPTYRKLTTGDSGLDVQSLQQRLVELGYSSGTPNGNYGTATAEAIVRLQTMLGYMPEEWGVATVALQRILFSTAAPVYVQKSSYEASYFESLEYGSSGNSVYTLKLRLMELGYLSSMVAGYEDVFDQNTLFAITNVEYMMGVAESDGIATPELQAFLYSDAALAISLAR